MARTSAKADRAACTVWATCSDVCAALTNQRGIFSRYGQVDLERTKALDDALRLVGPEDTAIRALSDWPDASVEKDLLNLAATDPNDTHKILAIRARWYCVKYS